jgi:hypothetical protein
MRVVVIEVERLPVAATFWRNCKCPGGMVGTWRVRP